ncbi:unnamed protein product, partial [Mesorhabditis spiculigera]
MGTELESLNTLCRDLYESVDQATRRRAEERFNDLVNGEGCLQRCMMLFEEGPVPYGPIVAAKALTKLLSVKTGIMPSDRLNICHYLLSYLGTRAQQVPAFVITELCQFFARLTKLEWGYFVTDTEEYPFRTPISSIIKSISVQNIGESLLAIELLSLLVIDMNSPIGSESVSTHRKTAALFRDDYLYNIFKMCLELLKELQGKQLNEQELRLANAVLDLMLNCCSYDFIGSLADETSEDNFSMQIVHIIVQLASIRRTIFNGNERQTYLRELVVAIKEIIENSAKLNQGAFHEFCRLVSRLKTNFQLCEMLKFDEYESMLRLLVEFTIASLKMTDLSNSTYFLLHFWFRMVTSVPYVRTQDNHYINIYCPEIFKVYVETRLENVANVLRDPNLDDPLDDQGAILQTMEQLAVICRCDYKKTGELLMRHFDENVEVALRGPAQDPNVLIAEGRLAWLLTLMGTAIFGKSTVQNTDEFDELDGKLLLRAIRYMQWNDERLVCPTNPNLSPGNGNIRLEVSFIYVLEQFRRAYVMDQIPRVSYVYNPLGEIGINEETDMLNVIARKIITNVKMWPTNAQLLDLSLSLLKDLSLGYSAVRKLFSLPDIQLLLNNHTAEHFAFLGSGIDYATMKERTTFYEALTRLLTSDMNDDEVIFLNYLQPLTETARNLCEVMKTGNIQVNEDEVKKALVGLCRDIRGVCLACTTKPLFQMLVEWMLPDVFNILQFAINGWYNIPEVTSPIFHLLSELCHNRQQRLKFEMSSCVTVLLFREISRVICSWGDRVLNAGAIAKDRLYKERYKNIGLIFHILKQALAGGYVPYGLLCLYGDRCLLDALDMFVKLFQTIPEEEFHNYTKITQNYYGLLEMMIQDNMSYISNLDPQVFSSILRSIISGILSTDAVVITAACSALDNILGCIMKQLKTPTLNKITMEAEGQSCIRAIEANPHLLADLLNQVIQMFIYGEVKCQWSMSRPLLGLILLQEQAFNEIKTDVLTHFPSSRRPSMEKTFFTLMDGVEADLTTKNKDTFTQNLAKFRKEVSEVAKGKDLSPAASNTNMAF